MFFSYPGWCSVGGKIRAIGAGFTCVDNINTCSCLVGGGMMTTLVYPNPVMFCNAHMEQSNRTDDVIMLSPLTVFFVSKISRTCILKTRRF